MNTKKTVVIFVFTQQQATWAGDYVRVHPKLNIKILAPTILTQLHLQKKGLHYLDYFSPELYQPSSYADRIKRQIMLANQMTEFFLKQLPKNLSIKDVPLARILENTFRWEFLITICAYDFFRAVEEKWNPTRYFIPSNTGMLGVTGTTDPEFTVAALIGRFFASKKKVKPYVTPKSSVLFANIRWVAGIIFPIQLFAVKLVGYILQKITLLRFHLFPPDIRGKKVLFYSFGYNLDYYAPFFSLLRKKNLLEKFLLVTGQQPLEAEWFLRKHSIPFISMQSFLSKKIQQKGRILEKKIIQDVHALSEKGVKNWFPTSLPGNLKTALTGKMLMIFQSHGKKFILHTLLAEEIIRQSNPSLVIVSHDPSPSSTSFIHLAQQGHRKTLVLLHGIIGEGLTENHRSDFAAVWGSWTKDYYVRTHQKSPHSLYEVGFPMLDPVLRSNVPFWKYGPQQSILRPPIHLSLLLCQYVPDSFIFSKFLDELFQVLSNDVQNTYKVSIRLHRDQPSQGISELGKFYNIPLQLNPYELLERFVEKSDIVLANDTTAILWPMIYGKPLFYTTPWWGSGFLPIEKYDAAWIPQGPEDIVNRIHTLQQNPQILSEIHLGQKRFLQDYVGNLEGKSSEDLLQLILQLTDIS